MPQVSDSGEEAYLADTIKAPFTEFEVKGHSEQDGDPTPESPVDVKSCGENGTINEKISNKNLFDGEMELGTFSNNDGSPVNINTQIRTKNFTRVKSNSVCSLSNSNNYTTFIYFYDKDKKLIKYINSASFTTTEDTKFIKFRTVGNQTDLTTKFQLEYGNATDIVSHEEQNISIPTQQPMRSIGEVEDEFVKKNDGKWYERHYISYIASYNGETLPQDVYNEDGGIKYCNEKSMSTTGQFSTGASVQYVAITPTDLLCTQEQSDILDSLTEDTITYKGETYITSPDEVKARIKVSGLRDLNVLFNN